MSVRFGLGRPVRRADRVRDLQGRRGRFFFRRRVGVRERDRVRARGERKLGTVTLPPEGAISVAAAPLTETVVFQPVPLGAVSATEQLAPWTAPVSVGRRGAAVAERGGREARRAGAAVGELLFRPGAAARRADRVGDLQRRGRFFFRFFDDRFAADRDVRGLVDVVGAAGAAGEADVDLRRQRDGGAQVLGAFDPDVDGAVQRFDLDVAGRRAQRRDRGRGREPVQQARAVRAVADAGEVARGVGRVLVGVEADGDAGDAGEAEPAALFAERASARLCSRRRTSASGRRRRCRR